MKGREIRLRFGGENEPQDADRKRAHPRRCSPLPGTGSVRSGTQSSKARTLGEPRLEALRRDAKGTPEEEARDRHGHRKVTRIDALVPLLECEEVDDEQRADRAEQDELIAHLLRRTGRGGERRAHDNEPGTFDDVDALKERYPSEHSRERDGLGKERALPADGRERGLQRAADRHGMSGCREVDPDIRQEYGGEDRDR